MLRMHVRFPYMLAYICTLLLCVLVFWIFIFPMTFPHFFKSSRHGLHKHPVTSYEVHYPMKKIPFSTNNSMFDGFDNVTGTKNGDYIVPNIIHYVRLRNANFSFVDAVCVLSAFKNHKPSMIIFHTDVNGFVGPYWKKIKNTPGFVYRINRVKIPKAIFGQKISKQYLLLHSGEFLKIKILMKFGGILLDNDVYVVRSLNVFRKFEMALGWEDGACMSTRVLIAHKEARFLKLWLQSFKEYYPRKWYYNAGCKPTWEILLQRPELVHRVKILFGLRSLARNLYRIWNWSKWKDFYTLPVLMRHGSLSKIHYKWLPKFDENNIKFYPLAFGEMARNVYSVY